MSSYSIAQAIRSHWDTYWQDRTPYTYDAFTYAPVAGTSWVRVSVRDGDGTQESLGKKALERSQGVVIVQIFVPMDLGEDEARFLAEKAGNVFRRQRFSGIQFRSPSHRPVGQDGGWWQHNVVIPYWHNAFQSALVAPEA